MIDNISQLPDCNKICLKWRELNQTIEQQTLLLYRAIRGRKGKDGFVPYFLPSAETPIAAIKQAEEELANLEKDGEEFCKSLGEFRSLKEMAEALRREKLKISGTAREARLTYERELKNCHELSPDEVAELDSVKSVNLKAERAQTECSPKVDDLSGRLAKAKLILEKYGNENMLAADKMLGKE